MKDIKKTISLNFSMKSWIYSKRVYIFAFFISALILFGAYAAFGVHPFGDNSVLVLDLNGQYVYYFENLRDAFWGNGSLTMSWSRNLSGEIIGIYAYYLASPFTLIVMLFPRSMITESLLIMQLCKVGSSAVAFCYFLKKSRKLSSRTALIFSISYSLMSYIIVQLMDPMWLDGLILLPLICIGIEKLIDENKWLYLIIPLALMFIANFYIGWMIAFFSVLYFIAYYFFISETTSPFSFKNFVQRGMAFAAGGFTSAALASWILIPLYYSLKLGKFNFTDPTYEWKTQFNIFDFFTNLMPNAYDTCRPEGSPVIYCGVITLILLPLFFFNRNIEFRKKIGYGMLAFSIIISMYVSNIDIAWHGFQVPNWLPYRYSFTFSFILLIMAAQAFERIEGITFKEIGIVFFLLIGSYFYLDKQDYKNIDTITSIWYAVLLTAIYALLLYMHKKNYKAKGFIIALIAFVAIEQFLSSLYTMDAINSDVVYSKYSSYNKYITLGRDTVSKIYDMDDDIYRIEKNYHRTVNDAMAFGSFGISHSSSTLNSAPIQFLRRLGFSYGGHYIKYKGSTYVTDAVLGIKYIMEKGSAVVDEGEQPVVEINNHYTDLVLANGNDKDIFYVYKNPYSLPIGFMADNAIKDVDVSGENPFYNQNQLLSALVSDQYTEYFKKIEIDNIIPENVNVSNYGNHTKYVRRVDGENAQVEYLFTAPSNDMIYMYLPSNYERKANLWLNDEFLDYYYEGGNMVIQTLGRFQQGEQISLVAAMNDEKDELLIKDQWFYSLDEEAFKAAVEKLKESPLEITYFKENHLKGNVTAKKDGVLFTTITYEPGWTVTVDGKKVEPVKLCNALIGIPVSAGTHQIEMKFFPYGMKLGMILSLSGLIIVIVIAISEHKAKKVLLDRLNEV